LTMESSLGIMKLARGIGFLMKIIDNKSAIPASYNYLYRTNNSLR
jgi:hypothetical protein